MSCPVAIVVLLVFASREVRTSISIQFYTLQMVIAIGIMINVWRAKVRESIGCIKESFITILITTAILAGSPAIRGAVPEVYIFHTFTSACVPL